MKKILYIVSTLQRSGPTVQLYNLIKHLDTRKFLPTILTLSPESNNSALNDFEELNIHVLTLGLDRLNGLLRGKSALIQIMEKIEPDLIHSQGIRADSLMSKINTHIPWIMTARNFPPEDYFTKFGKLKGYLMVHRHFAVMRDCDHVISCSKTISKKLREIGIISTPIQNGTSRKLSKQELSEKHFQFPHPIFISVGSLIPRKNMAMLVSAFSSSDYKRGGSLVILGDGPELSALRSLGNSNVHLLGNVNNVPEFLLYADFFVSCSLSEGLPNTVLEALAAGLPCLLSAIPSHLEISTECPEAVWVFSLDDGVQALTKGLNDASLRFSNNSREAALCAAKNIFSADRMSQDYQNYYARMLA